MVQKSKDSKRHTVEYFSACYPLLVTTEFIFLPQILFAHTSKYQFIPLSHPPPAL